MRKNICKKADYKMLVKWAFVQIFLDYYLFIYYLLMLMVLNDKTTKIEINEAGNTERGDRA